MKTVYAFLVLCLIVAVTMAAGLQFGAPWRLSGDWVATFGLVPLALMIIAIFRAPDHIPSWLAFACGLIMDTLSHGVLGYWALTYTICTLVARLIPIWITEQLTTRICAHAVMVACVFLLHILLSSLVFLSELAWHETAYSVRRMFLCVIAIELALAVFANLSFRLAGFGRLSQTEISRNIHNVG